MSIERQIEIDITGLDVIIRGTSIVGAVRGTYDAGNPIDQPEDASIDDLTAHAVFNIRGTTFEIDITDLLRRADMLEDIESETIEWALT